MNGAHPPYSVIADCLKEQTVVPFLGAAASAAGAPENQALPMGSQLARILANRNDYPRRNVEPPDPLSKVAEFVAGASADRRRLIDIIHTVFYSDLPQDYHCSLTDFLAAAPEKAIPRLFISTNYDCLVERALEHRSIPFLAISQVSRRQRLSGRFLCYTSLNQNEPELLTRDQLKTRLGACPLLGALETATNDSPRVIVYKMHGTTFLNEAASEGSIVVTESDYVTFLADNTLQSMPAIILDALVRGRILFLGYSLSDWNFRVLLQRVRRLQEGSSMANWAVLRHTDEIEKEFWLRRGVRLYEMALEEFLMELQSKLAS